MRVPRQPAYHPPTGPPAEPAGPPERRRRRARGLRWFALISTVLVLAGSLGGWLWLRGLDTGLTTDTATARELARHREERPAPAPGKARNILLIRSDAAAAGDGDDTADGAAGAEGLVLLHLAGDGSSATALGIPRTLETRIPACAGTDGTALDPREGSLAAAYGSGGAACAIRTLERLTGVRVDHHLIIDVEALREVADAVGGVEPCTLDALARKVSSSGVLLNPARLLPVLNALSASITTDAELDSLAELWQLIGTIRAVPRDAMAFLTVPLADGGLRQPDANHLFAALREDTEVDPDWGGDTTGGPASGDTGLCASAGPTG
ncbi:LCP family protein [Streptomyces sp. RFCAC02]|uniref:LCP family protein n=1 Tax=Streptomyces sp. RFCAC02 TaxID=2499143 RepID=UPI00102101CA|nr:LCP family protein [Streptomyces sp. RFCAC02]